MAEDEIPTSEKFQVSSPKLVLKKNSRGYSWDIQILSLDVDELERINDDMLSRFKGDDE